MPIVASTLEVNCNEPTSLAVVSPTTPIVKAAVAHPCAASRKMSDGPGCTMLKWRTSPAARAASSTASPRVEPKKLDDRALGQRLQDADAFDGLQPSVRRAYDLDPDQAPAVAGTQVGHPAVRDDVTGVDQDDGFAQPLDQLELVTGEHHRDARRRLIAQHAREHVHPHGIQS